MAHGVKGLRWGDGRDVGKTFEQRFQKIRPEIIEYGNAVIRSRPSGYQLAEKPVILVT